MKGKAAAKLSTKSKPSPAEPKWPRPVYTYNPHANPLEACQQMIGYKFHRIELLEEALDRVRNQRLALVGDRALNMIMVTRFYSSKATMLQWAEGISSATSNDHLYVAGIKCGINYFMMPPLGAADTDRIQDLSASRKRVADAVEAIIGAVFEDQLSVNRTVNWDEFDSVVYRFGVVHEMLVKYADRRNTVYTSQRMLPKTFFKGHQAALHDVLFEHMSMVKINAPGRPPEETSIRSDASPSVVKDYKVQEFDEIPDKESHEKADEQPVEDISTPGLQASSNPPKSVDIAQARAQESTLKEGESSTGTRLKRKRKAKAKGT